MSRSTMMRSKALAGRVRRYHTWPTLHTESVAEHSHRVAMIYMELFGVDAEALAYIMCHDLCELWTGDLPFPVKARNPALKKAVDAVEKQAAAELGLPDIPTLEDWKKRLVKICDLLQMWEFGHIELMMGNALALPVIKDTIRIALEMCYSESERLLVQVWADKQKELINGQQD